MSSKLFHNKLPEAKSEKSRRRFHWVACQNLNLIWQDRSTGNFSPNDTFRPIFAMNKNLRWKGHNLALFCGCRFGSWCLACSTGSPENCKRIQFAAGSCFPIDFYIFAQQVAIYYTSPYVCMFPLLYLAPHKSWKCTFPRDCSHLDVSKFCRLRRFLWSPSREVSVCTRSILGLVPLWS